MSTLEIPTRLPVDALSVSSVSLFARCPEHWRRRYLERMYEAPSGAMLLGSAVGAAEAQADHQQMESGERPSSDFTLDVFSDEFEERTGREEVDWGTSKPGDVKDAGIRVVQAYDEQVAPHVQPVAVEREFNLSFDGVEWGFRGFIDLEEADGAVVDRKVKGKKLTPADASVDLQASAYLMARRAEGNPAPVFRFHDCVKTKTPYAEVLPTTRTDAQLDAFIDRLFRVAAEMNWRITNEVWGYAPPGSWWCSERMCGHWRNCAGGGLR